MAHNEQQEFCKKISNLFPTHFINKKVLDVGSLDVNGTNRDLFIDCNYIGLDLGEGPNVDISCMCHEYDAPNDYFDTIICTNMFEHDMFYQKSIINIIRMLKPGGAFIFTCPSLDFPEHGTKRSDNGISAPLLEQRSINWADYYKNLTDEDIHIIKGFDEAFPDGLFEYRNDPGAQEIYFYGVKGGITNNKKYEEVIVESIIDPTEYPDDIFVVDTWPNTSEKEADLVKCIQRLKVFKGIPILLVSHYPIKPEIQKLVDYYIFDKDNPILTFDEYQEHALSSGRWSKIDGYYIENEMEFHHDYAIWTSMKNAFNFCKFLGKKTIHFMEYDNIVDAFQYKQAFLEKSKLHDAVVYEYHKNSMVDPHLSAYLATYIFSIKTDIAINLISKINSKYEYFINRPQGWQLERIFLRYLRECTNDIVRTEYIDNYNTLNTQEVWDRDGVNRNGAKFQIYPGVSDTGHFFIHLISGFHEQAVDEDYLIEIRYGLINKFITLIHNGYGLIDLGKYVKGLTVYIHYSGKTVYSKFLGDDFNTFIKLNKVIDKEFKPKVSAKYNFVDGAYVQLESNLPDPCVINFIDKQTNQLIYTSNLTNNCWARSNNKFVTDWKILINTFDNRLIYEINFDASNKNVYIAVDSIALGDTIAWFPYVEEFRKKNKCNVTCSTFWNDLFKVNYPEITFVSPGTVVNDLYAMFKIGYYYKDDIFDNDRNPNDPILQPLQKTSSDILGLPYYEIKPIISYPIIERKKKVGLGIHSTSQGKYWNNPGGWQQVVNWLIDNGYEPIILSKEADGYMGNHNPKKAKKLPPSNITKVINTLAECSAFIGISSGLTWLAWATNTPTIQISGYTEPFNEPDSGIIKISAHANSCSGCANRFKFDHSDWKWCPVHKGTNRQFECSKLITADQVINELKKILL